LGQKRALVGWQRIIYPDGSSISLEMMPGADVSGVDFPFVYEIPSTGRFK